MAKGDLDPEDWQAFRATAHDLLDRCIDHIAQAGRHPWQPVPEKVRAGYALSGAGSDEAALAARLADAILPYGTGNTHPRFFGWVHGTGLAAGLMAEMVAATMNANLGGRDHGAVHVERAVIDWTRRTMGFPRGASGVLVTGTSQATLIALAAARVATLGPESRLTGMQGARLVAYAGAGVHNAALKAMEVLGLGRDALRRVAEGKDGIDMSALRRAVAEDRAAGHHPFAVIGTAGSVDLGRFDDLNALADFSAEEGLWLHVDGAFGAWTRLADPPWHDLTDGIGRADSLACDFHKWMYVPYDCGLVLIRDEAAHRAAFAARPAYLAAQEAGLGGGEPWFCDYGIDLSRGNRALKVWAAIECYGAERLGAAITRNCRLAAHMAESVAATPGMRLAAPVVSNVCVFTADDSLPDAAQSALNARIAQALQMSGAAVFSTTAIDGVTCLRAAITNHRTRTGDVDAAIAAVARAREAAA